VELLTRHRHLDTNVDRHEATVALWPRLFQIVAALVAVAVTAITWATPHAGPTATVVVVAAIFVVAALQPFAEARR
jgi:hypothetical protein